MSEPLRPLRQRINEIDSQLLRLISERGNIAQQIAEIKKAQGEKQCYRPEREADILSNLIQQNPGPLKKEEIAHLFREIISACRALEQSLHIAYLGPAGTFTEVAAYKHFGHSINPVPLSTINQIFQEVESDNSQYGVVPVENSIEGVVNHTLDMLIDSRLKICGEIELRINHLLLSKEKNNDNITYLYSHQQSLAQCRSWLDTHLPKAERVAVNSTAEAAKIASIKNNTAAIAGETAAENYGLTTLAKNIADDPNNTTRFLVIGKNTPSPSGNDKTSLLFSTPHESGALQNMLGHFSDTKVNMTRIESRPSRKGMWQYVFFVDIEGHEKEENVTEALKRLKKSATMMKLLGSYPRSVL